MDYMEENMNKRSKNKPQLRRKAAGFDIIYDSSVMEGLSIMMSVVVIGFMIVSLFVN